MARAQNVKVSVLLDPDSSAFDKIRTDYGFTQDIKTLTANELSVLLFHHRRGTTWTRMYIPFSPGRHDARAQYARANQNYRRLIKYGLLEEDRKLSSKKWRITEHGRKHVAHALRSAVPKVVEGGYADPRDKN